MEHQRNAVVREGMKQHLRYLQDIPHDQRTRRHAMQIEHYLLADKCIETIEKSNCAMSQGEPLHVAAARLGDPATYHAMLARIFFLSQVDRPSPATRHHACAGMCVFECILLMIIPSIFTALPAAVTAVPLQAPRSERHIDLNTVALGAPGHHG